jgi:chromosome segregation ATPase
MQALGAACVVLAVGLAYLELQRTAEQRADIDMIGRVSNEWVQAGQKLEEQKMVNLSLERDLTTQAEEIKTYSNNLAVANENFAKASADAKTAAEVAKEEVRRRDSRISDLENERDGMTKNMGELTTSIASLETQIAETQHKLEGSEGDREFLLGELKRLQMEKSDHEKQFNDLAMLREQVKKLRDELSTSRRLDWIRRGLYGNLKGGEVLRKGFASTGNAQTNYNLDVEIRRDGGARVIPSTNSIPTNNPPVHP